VPPLTHSFMRFISCFQMNMRVSQLPYPPPRLFYSHWPATGPKLLSYPFLGSSTKSWARTFRSVIPPIAKVLNLCFHCRNASPQQKFGAFNMTAALGPWIMRHPEVKNNMEQFMLQFVKPVLMNPNSEAYNRAIVRFFVAFSGQALRFYDLSFRRWKSWERLRRLD
jgi:hypothetical protein